MFSRLGPPILTGPLRRGGSPQALNAVLLLGLALSDFGKWVPYMPPLATSLLHSWHCARSLSFLAAGPSTLHRWSGLVLSEEELHPHHLAAHPHRFRRYNSTPVRALHPASRSLCCILTALLLHLLSTHTVGSLYVHVISPLNYSIPPQRRTSLPDACEQSHCLTYPVHLLKEHNKFDCGSGFGLGGSIQPLVTSV